uniref:carboxymuconolactone decarboxylase family protein n=1 Tax=Paractinoplanes polyasparticus TaxID=2856853 RepID=UPI001C845370|nr:carboxymuconolactone decarboxylase family protein [Actinoplanes polyasparticus]
MSTEFVKARLDASANERLMALAEAGAAAFGHQASLGLDGGVAQLVRLRVAQLNHCPYCLTVHQAAAHRAGIALPKINVLTAWWETQLFTEAEKAALAYAEALTLVAQSTRHRSFQEVHERLAVHFSQDEILELAAVVINMNIWTRLKLVEGAMPVETP